METTPITAAEWVAARTAGQMLGCDHRIVRRLAAEGLIGTRQIPGQTYTRFNADDIRALVAASIRPATVGPAASRPALPGSAVA